MSAVSHRSINLWLNDHFSTSTICPTTGPQEKLISSQDVSSVSRRSSTPIQEFAQPNHEEQSVSPVTPKEQNVKDKNIALPKSTLYNRIFEESWVAEIIALCIAALATVVIIIILAIFKDKPLSQWHSRVTINTLVNFVSQAAQTALLLPVASSISQMKWIHFQRKRNPLGDMEDFDKASRQVFDSLLLVFKLPKRILVYLAALNAVLILLYGPFVQQSVALPIRNDKFRGHGGSIPVAVTYGTTATSQAFDPPGTPMNYISYTSVGSKMKQAIIAGILGDPQPSPSDVKALCTTGNCTFDPYSSLGACSSIEDVTPTIIDDCAEDKRCNYTVKALEAKAPWHDEIMIPDFVLWMGSPGSSASIDNQSRKLTYHIANSSLSEFYLLFYKDLSMRDKEHLVAFKGTLSLCVHTYNTSVLNGVTNTTVINTQTNLTWSDTHANHQGDDLEYAEATGPRGQQFKVDPGSRKSIHEYMSKEIFTGEMLLGGPDYPNSTSGTAAGSVARAVYGDIDGGTVYLDRGVVIIDRRKRDVFPAGDELVTGGMKRVGDLLEGLAMHMSNAMRTTSNETTQIPATATKIEVYIAVNFYWLILPIAAVLLTLLLVAIVVFESKSRHIPAWKSSQLAALLSIDSGTSMALVDASITQAQNLPVRLAKEDGKWLLKGGDWGK